MALDYMISRYQISVSFYRLYILLLSPAKLRFQVTRALKHLKSGPTRHVSWAMPSIAFFLGAAGSSFEFNTASFFSTIQCIYLKLINASYLEAPHVTNMPGEQPVMFILEVLSKLQWRSKTTALSFAKSFNKPLLAFFPTPDADHLLELMDRMVRFFCTTESCSVLCRPVLVPRAFSHPLSPLSSPSLVPGPIVRRALCFLC